MAIAYCLMGVIVIVAMIIFLLVKMHGDVDFKFFPAERSQFVLVEKDQSRAVFSCEVPFINDGRQNGTIIDCFPRHYMPREYYDDCIVESRLTLPESNREDGYWEATIFKRGIRNKIILTVIFIAKSGSISVALQDLPDMNMDIIYQTVGRSDYMMKKDRLLVESDEIRAAFFSGGLQGVK